MSTFYQKLSISASSALLFLIVNLPIIYQLTDKIFGGLLSDNKCPTTKGILLHTLVFFLVTYLSMGGNAPPSIKAGRALSASLVFLLLTSPFGYNITSSLFKHTIQCSTQEGLLLHTIIYTGILTLLMYN